jgi:hypothetical protein
MSQCHSAARTKYAIMMEKDVASPAIFLTTGVMALANINFGKQPPTMISANHTDL